ncbi:hypothetical protein INT47_013007 [Mucor saturninus]|uniref:Uncharacterized protein n=1 Tax=Mucor saturninus TaxID=64648 RepID=A0A8H7R105_9FUNG|nr:hypothetical protein INT47_013007 [Mucor saturninus]
MKSTVAMTLLATVAMQQLVLAQGIELDAVNVATVPAVPTLPALVTDIYWWKTLLTGDEISNYLTAPATEAATATANAAVAGATTTTTAAVAAAATTSENASGSSAVASGSASVSGSSAAVSDASSAVSDISSSSAVVGASATPSVVAWSSSSSSSYAAASTVVPGKSTTVVLPRPSGSVTQPSTSAGAANSGAMIAADVGKVLFSVTIAAVLGNFF